VFAVLCNEPFNLTPEQVGKLTTWQVRNLYLCPRDEHGQVIVGRGETGAVPTLDELRRMREMMPDGDG
jgi:hypothetical protein